MSNTSNKIILGHNETETGQYQNSYCTFISFIKKYNYIHLNRES